MERVARSVRYAGSSIHKLHPGDYGFVPPVNPRPTKSACDDRRTVLKAEAEALLGQGISRGMTSRFGPGQLPKYIWAVGHDGEVYEAKTKPGLETAAYHGYRLGDDEKQMRSPQGVERAMPDGLEIRLEPEQLEEGTPEECAAFGMLTIRAGRFSLTQGYDTFVDALRDGPLVSGYHAAEWFALNWWRLMHEPSSRPSSDWWRAHAMNAIGEGYVWPNVTIRGDGVRVAILSDPSREPDARPFRYLGGHPWVGPRGTLEDAIDAFVPRVLERLHRRNLLSTNLEVAWGEVLAERADPDQTRRRRLEALLGRDPDEADDTVIQDLLNDAVRLGEPAVDELAADAPDGHPVNADRLGGIALRDGVDARRSDAVSLGSDRLAQALEQDVAWRRGAAAAAALRSQEQIGAAPISTHRLCQMAGVSTAVAQKTTLGAPLSFLLAGHGGTDRVVLRPKWETGRRFDLARLLGDHLLFDQQSNMLPVTRAYTFRQKAQRSFAAELLAPFVAVENMLRGDFSHEAVDEAAEHFDVSPWTIRTLLQNNGLIERDHLADAA